MVSGFDSRYAIAVSRKSQITIFDLTAQCFEARSKYWLTMARNRLAAAFSSVTVAKVSDRRFLSLISLPVDKDFVKELYDALYVDERKIWIDWQDTPFTADW